MVTPDSAGWHDLYQTLSAGPLRLEDLRPRGRGTGRMNRLRNQLILIFLAATLAPLAATVWYTTWLLEPHWILPPRPGLEPFRAPWSHQPEFYQREFRRSEGERVQAGRSRSPRNSLSPARDSWPDGSARLRRSDEAEQFDYGPERRPPGLPGAPRRRRLDVFHQPCTTWPGA